MRITAPVVPDVRSLHALFAGVFGMTSIRLFTTESQPLK
jgi:hypothetical protein